MTVYRWIENNLPNINADVLPAGGRDVVLEVFARRKEFGKTRAVFLLDSDVSLFCGYPVQSDDVFWTHGYSIENDLLSSGVIDALLTKDEKAFVLKAIDEIAGWFAYEVWLRGTGKAVELAIHPKELLDVKLCSLKPKFVDRPCLFVGQRSAKQS